MAFLLRLFTAFCVATVLAQAIILGLTAARGNLRGETLTKAFALFNGIDVQGEQLRKAFEDAKQVPVPAYDDVTAQRAQQNLNLEMRERSIKFSQQQLETMQAKLRDEQIAFDRRKDAFHQLLDKMEQDAKKANLGEIQRTLEAISPEQAKIMLLKMLDMNQMSEVVAIVKGMPADKRKKLIAEFASEKEYSQLYEIFNQILQGQPAAGAINEARTEPESDAS